MTIIEKIMKCNIAETVQEKHLKMGNKVKEMKVEDGIKRMCTGCRMAIRPNEKYVLTVHGYYHAVPVKEKRKANSCMHHCFQLEAEKRASLVRALLCPNAIAD